MWVPLVVLAIFATIGGLVGIGPAFKPITGSEHAGGKLNIVNWLNPIIWNAETGEFNIPEAGEHAAVAEHGSVAEHAAPAEHEHLGTEWLFIGISIAVAGIGMALGWLFYLKQPSLPDIWAARLRPLYQASYNKFWVDEFYGWAITRRTMDAARAVFTFDSRVVDGIVNGLAALGRGLSQVVGAVDKYFVDGVVNTIAAFIKRLMSPLFRAAQTGFTQNYALVMVLGLMIAVVIFFARDIF
jgi:NADH-quinone oxidoreductase subunit L